VSAKRRFGRKVVKSARLLCARTGKALPDGPQRMLANIKSSTFDRAPIDAFRSRPLFHAPVAIER
jgi:hypothetical protein